MSVAPTSIVEPSPITPHVETPKVSAISATSEKRIRLDERPQPRGVEKMEFESKPVVNEFANFKFPEETRGQKLNDINELSLIEKQSKEACERQALVYNMDQVESGGPQGEAGKGQAEELTDDFFDITVNDLRFVLSDLKRVQGDEQPLMTKAMRELEQGNLSAIFVLSNFFESFYRLVLKFNLFF